MVLGVSEAVPIPNLMTQHLARGPGGRKAITGGGTLRTEGKPTWSSRNRDLLVPECSHHVDLGPPTCQDFLLDAVGDSAPLGAEC